jgi:hypothetical protein
MNLYFVLNRTVNDVQRDFNQAYPFLKIEFYKTIEPGFSRKLLTPATSIRAAGLKREGVLELSDTMTVGQLEKTFKDNFGLNVQVSRRSGILWLETTRSDGWTLKQQNEHGKELSQKDNSEKIDMNAFDYE